MKSSNVGFGKVSWMLTPPVMNRYIRDFGYRSRTGIYLPGEQTATQDAIRPTKDLLSVSRVGFGQGIAVTQLQSTMAMGAIANEGVLMKPQIIVRIEDAEGRIQYEQPPQEIRRVISQKTAKDAVHGLRSVVEGKESMRGTASAARMRYHTVGGKTGTAQKMNPEIAAAIKKGAKGNVYEGGGYYASFIGFFPTTDPVILISVMVDHPTKVDMYGGAICAPAFKNIAEGVAQYLAIPPDKDLEKKSKS